MLRVSYRDMMLIADILNRIKELSANALARQIMQQERSKDQEAQGTPGRQPNTVMMPEVPLDRPQRRGVDAGEATRVRLGSSSSQRMSSQLVHESVSLSLLFPALHWVECGLMVCVWVGGVDCRSKCRPKESKWC